MKKILIIMIFIITFLLVYFLQTNFFSWYNIVGIKPNLFIIFILFIGLYVGKYYGLAFGIIFGIFLDLFVGKKIGINGVMLGTCGVIGGILDKSFSKESKITFIIMTILITMLCDIINYILQIIFLNANASFIQFMYIALIESLYNGILIVILYPIIQFFGEKIEDIFKTKKSFMKYY